MIFLYISVVLSYHFYNYNNIQVYDLNNVIHLYEKIASIHYASYIGHFTIHPSLERFTKYVKV